MRITGGRLMAMLAVVVATAAGLAPGTASAGQPIVEHLNIDRVRPDPDLTAACGVSVTARVHGLVVIRTFPEGGTGPAELVTLNITVTAMAGDNSYTFRLVGADLVRIEPDGTAILIRTGQSAFEWIGVLKINLDTGEVILEPHHSLEGQQQEACEALTA